MITSQLYLGKSVYVEKTASINNVRIGDDVKIGGYATIFGSSDNVLQIGEGCYIGPNSLVDGYHGRITIGMYVSIAQNVKILSGSGPNASKSLQKIFPITKGDIKIGNHSWIGANAVVMPNSIIGKYSVVAANSFVNSSFPDYSIIGGTPAKIIRSLTAEEIESLK